MGKKERFSPDHGLIIQTSVYLPSQIYSHYKKAYREMGYTSIADYMRGVLRQHFLSNRVGAKNEKI